MKEFYLSLKDGKLFYKKNDFNFRRKTLVFIHGLSGSSSAWIPYEDFFSKKYNVLSFDLRGHGKSFRMKNYGDLSFDKMSEDLYALLKHEKVKKFILVSHSLGTLVAFDFINRYKKMIEKTIFLSPDYNSSERGSTKVLKYLFLPTKIMNYFPMIKHFGKQVDYSFHKNSGDWNVKRMIADISNTGLRNFFFCTLYSCYPNYTEVLRDLKMPVLIVHGRKDSIIPVKKSEEMNKLVKNSKLVILEDADHIVVLNNFNEVSREIEKFISC